MRVVVGLGPRNLFRNSIRNDPPDMTGRPGPKRVMQFFWNCLMRRRCRHELRLLRYGTFRLWGGLLPQLVLGNSTITGVVKGYVEFDNEPLCEEKRRFGLLSIFYRYTVLIVPYRTVHVYLQSVADEPRVVSVKINFCGKTFVHKDRFFLEFYTRTSS